MEDSGERFNDEQTLNQEVAFENMGEIELPSKSVLERGSFKFRISMNDVRDKYYLSNQNLSHQ